MKRRENGWALQIPGHDLWSEHISPTGEKRYTNNINGCETYDPPLEFRGGILADDMGLGKTLSMIALIASDLLGSPAATLRNYTYGSLQRHVSPADATRCGKIPQYVASTLLVMPASVLQHWEIHLKQHLQADGPIRWTIHHGSSKIKSRNEISNYCIVVTTFPTVASEFQKPHSPLFNVFWRRVVLDEAHTIRNRRTVTAKALFRLEGISRWAITGTPIQNRMSDFASLLQFLRVYPYCDREVLAADILNVWRSHDENLALDRLKRLFRYISIRRLKTILDLPKRRDFVRYLSFNKDESAAYMALESPIAMMLDEELQSVYNGPSRYVKALAKINMLRRFCNLGLCLQEQLDTPNGYISPRASSMTNSEDLLDDMLSSGQSMCSICDSEINYAMQENFAETSSYWAQYSTLICYTCYIQTKVGLKLPPQFDHRNGHIHREPVPAAQLQSISSTRPTSSVHMSTKIKALQEDLIQHKDEKWYVQIHSLYFKSLELSLALSSPHGPQLLT